MNVVGFTVCGVRITSEYKFIYFPRQKTSRYKHVFGKKSFIISLINGKNYIERKVILVICNSCDSFYILGDTDIWMTETHFI